MSISVNEPETGMECQLEIKTIVMDEQPMWSVTALDGQVVLFGLRNGKWVKQPGGKISQKFSVSIGHILDLLSKYEGSGRDMEACYRTQWSKNWAMPL